MESRLSSRHHLLECANQPKIVECGWAKRVDEPPDVCHGLFDSRRQIGQHRIRRGSVSELATCRFDLQAERRKRWTEAVVQIAPKPTAFFLASGDKALAGLLELCVKSDGIQRRRCLAAQVVEQPEVGGVKRLRPTPPADDQHADSLSAMIERQLLRRTIQDTN